MVRARTCARTAAALCLLAGVGVSMASCGSSNPGLDPPERSLSFPSGLLLDPRVEPGPVCSDDGDCLGECTDAGFCGCTTDDECSAGLWCTSQGLCQEPARWLYVTNANSDRRYNAGSLVALDLDGFWAALAVEDQILDSSETLAYTPREPTDEYQVHDVSESPVCRRIANLPQAVECLEEPFAAVEATTRFGNFPGPAAAWMPNEGEATLLIPVRGDPSVTYVDLSGGLDGGVPTLDCGQANNADDPRRCDDSHRLRFVRNDSDGDRLAREPFRVLVSPGPGRPLAYVSHQGDQDLTIISLDGLNQLQTESTDYGPAPVIDEDGEFVHAYDGKPAIVDQANVLGILGQGTDFQGGFGLAQRPCEPDTNAPDVTLDCNRPLVYGGMRWSAELRTFTALDHEPESGQVCENPGVDASALSQTSVKMRKDNLPGFDITGQIVCEPQVAGLRSIDPGGLPALQISRSRPVLADIGFSRTGDELYVVQVNPGALLRVDTSLATDGDAVDAATGQVEVCSQPTSLAIYDDGQVEYGLVTCYRSGEVFIVDLAQLTVVGLSRAGIGPNTMTVDLVREAVYVANSLDATISVIDMNPQHASRFTQIARLGIQEPYVQ